VEAEEKEKHLEQYVMLEQKEIITRKK